MISVLKNSFSKPSRKILEALPLYVRSVAKYSVSRIIDSKATIMQGDKFPILCQSHMQTAWHAINV